VLLRPLAGFWEGPKGEGEREGEWSRGTGEGRGEEAREQSDSQTKMLATALLQFYILGIQIFTHPGHCTFEM